MDAAVLRIIDANLNRVNEGLRVAEEHARFVRDDAALCRQLKQCRHDLRSAADRLRASLPADRLPEAFRDTVGDVGTVVTTASEFARADAASVAKASIKRAQEGLRALEEYGKLVCAEAAASFQAIRYALYTIETRLLSGDARRQKLRDARLYVLVTDSLASTDALTACREAVAGGADIIQMREKELEDKAFYELALQMRDVCAAAGALFLINDRPHIASLVDADGIHSGQGDLPVHLARRVIGAGRVIGRSTSGPEFAAQAEADGADYVGVGPVYETNTKQHRAPVGLEYVRWASEHAALPFFAIGSINRKTLHGVLEAGARAVAVCTGIIAARDIAAEAAWYKEQIEAAVAGPAREMTARATATGGSD